MATFWPTFSTSPSHRTRWPVKTTSPLPADPDGIQAPQTLRDSALEYGSGILGGLLSSLPLLFTREVWPTGFLASPSRLVCGVVATPLLLFAFNRVAGLREDASLLE